MMGYVLFNGAIKERYSVNIDIEDRGYQFGDGIYEVVRVYNGRPYLLSEHLERLYESAEKIYMTIPYDRRTLEEQLHELLDKENLPSCNIYIQYTRGIAPRRHEFSKDMEGNLLAYCLPAKRPDDEMEQGVKGVLAEDIRWLRCDIKSISLLGNVLLKQKAKENGGFEAILHRGDIITEGSSSNIWMVKDGIVQTHPADQMILNGITRQRIIALSQQEKIPVREKPFTVSDLLMADEVFLSSTTSEIIPITMVDDRRIGTGKPGPVVRKLQRLLQEDIEKQCGAIR